MGLRQERSIFQESSELQLQILSAESPKDICRPPIRKKSNWDCSSILALAASLPESDNVWKSCVSIFMQSLPGCVFSGVFLDSRSGAFQASCVYPFASQTWVVTTAFFILWHMIPKQNFRSSYPSINHHTFLSGMPVIALCIELGRANMPTDFPVWMVCFSSGLYSNTCLCCTSSWQS